MDRFIAERDYVFGEVVVRDELARDIWLPFDTTEVDGPSEQARP